MIAHYLSKTATILLILQDKILIFLIRFCPPVRLLENSHYLSIRYLSKTATISHILQSLHLSSSSPGLLDDQLCSNKYLATLTSDHPSAKKA